MYDARRWFILGMAFCLCIGLCAPGFAQINRGTIKGTVTDQSGAVVAGASVTATHVATGVDSKATTENNGSFTIPFLPPGVYRVTVEQPGFKKAVFENITLPVGDTIRQDVTLAVGEVSQTVSVEGATILNSNGSGDGRIIGFPQDAVQEFKLVSNNYSAEMGRAGGGFVNFNLRSGTNEIHGSAWEFLRNDAFNANGFFTNQGAPDPATGKAKRSILRQNEFGVTAGGPIQTDKTFAFGWYSGFRFQRGAQNTVVTMPTDAFKNGDFSQVLAEQGRQIYDPATTRTDASGNVIRDPFPGNIIHQDRFDPVSVAFLMFFVEPTDPSKIINNYVASTLATRSTNQWGVKIDHNFSEKHKIFGSYLKSNYVTRGGSPYPGALDSAGIGGYPIQIFRLTYDTVLRPNLLNHAIFGFNRHTYRGESTTNGQGIPAQIGLK